MWARHVELSETSPIIQGDSSSQAPQNDVLVGLCKSVTTVWRAKDKLILIAK